MLVSLQSHTLQLSRLVNGNGLHMPQKSVSVTCSRNLSALRAVEIAQRYMQMGQTFRRTNSQLKYGPPKISACVCDPRIAVYRTDPPNTFWNGILVAFLYDTSNRNNLRHGCTYVSNWITKELFRFYIITTESATDCPKQIARKPWF